MFKRQIKFYVKSISILYLLCVFFYPKTVSAGIYDNAITFWNQYGNNGTQSGEYFYFCTKGGTAQGGIKYKTIGYSATVQVNGSNLEVAQFKLQSSYDLDARELGGDTYILRRIPVTKVESRVQLANDDKVLYQLYTASQKYTFNSIMTVTENGTDKGSVSELSNGKVSSSGEVYTTLNGIKGARNWTTPSDLNNYFGKVIQVNPVNPLSVNRISISGNNVYHAGTRNGDVTYYVKPSTRASLSFTTGSEFTSTNFKPNANLFHVTGHGNNECVDVRTEMNNNNCLYWKDSGAIGVSSASSSRSGGNLTSTITGTLDVPNEKSINVYPQGKVFLIRSITVNNNRRSDDYVACDTPKYDSSKRVVVIGDGVAPTISVNGSVVTAWDGGSGLRSITLLKADGSVYTTYYGSSYTVPMGKYTAYAEDNVGNRSVSVSISNEALVKLYVNNNNGWNPGNIQIRGTTSKGKIGAIVVWCESVGQTENSPSALYFPLNGADVTVSFHPQCFYSHMDGGYLIHAKTVVYNSIGSEFLGQDEIAFYANMDFVGPAIGWGSANEAEVRWGKPGETYDFACISRDYNKHAGYGASFTSGVQWLSISNANTGELLSYGNYNDAIDHFVTNATVAGDVRLMLQAADYAGNVSTGYTTVRFDAAIPKVFLNVYEEKGRHFPKSGWRSGGVVLRADMTDTETGIYESGWKAIRKTDGNVDASWKDVVPLYNVPYWKFYYPLFAPGRSMNRYNNLTFTNEGSYTLQFYAIDGCENQSVASMEVKIDQTPPSVSYKGADVWNPKQFAVTVNDNEERANEVSGVKITSCYYVKGNENVLITERGDSGTFDVNVMSDFFSKAANKSYRTDGLHSLLLESTDHVEKTSKKNVTVYLDETLPRYGVQTVGGRGLFSWNPSKLTFWFQDDTSGIRYYKIEEERGGKVITRAEAGYKGEEGVSTKVGSYDMGKDIDVTISLTGYEGGKFFVYEVDEAGNAKRGEYQPPWEVEKPQCTMERFGETNGWNPQYVKLTYSDGVSGLANIKVAEGKSYGMLLANVSFNEAETIRRSYVETVQTHRFDESVNSLYWSATDHAGNYNDGNLPLKIDRTAPQGNVTYDKETQTVSIHDVVEERSGVDRAWVEIYKESGGSRRQTIQLSEVSQVKWEGKVEPEEEYLLSKSFMDVKIADKAGNEAVLGKLELDVFSLSATLHRSLSPDVENSVFQSGEQGYVTIKTFGYMDKVEIRFSPLLSQYDEDLEDIRYTLAPKVKDELSHYFYVPLYVPEGDYAIQVTGYKGSTSKMVPLTLRVKDTILNQFRTRIRG